MQKRVLLVDDDAEICELIKRYVLKARPDTVVEYAADGLQAYAKVKANKYDLVISDVNMPKYDGNDFLNAIQALAVTVRPREILMISGNIENLNKKFLAEYRFIAKPFMSEHFIHTVQVIFQLQDEGRTAQDFFDQKKIDEAFVTPFIESVVEVMAKTAKTVCTKEIVAPRLNDLAIGDITAVIAMNSDTFYGNLAICFQDSCFLQIINNMFGEDNEKITPEMYNAAGEICNQVFGYAKTTLNERGHSIKAAIPSVIIGKGHSLMTPRESSSVSIKFSTEAGHFTLEMVTKNFYIRPVT